MDKRRLIRSLARAFVSNGALEHAWLQPLADRFGAQTTRPRLRDVIEFIEQDEELRKAVAEHWQQIDVPPAILPLPGMRPAAAFSNAAVERIETAGGLAEWLGVSCSELEWFADLKTLPANERLRHYRYRLLDKDGGRVRLIEAPKPRLKEMQRRILKGILDAVPMHDCVHGFRQGRNIQSFGAPHVGRAVVLKMDLEDFFPSIHRPRVQGLFRALGYPEGVADLLGGLCATRAPKGLGPPLYQWPHLPQGAPTSPALANLCAYHLDCRLHGLAAASGAAYTRYADDMAFSGEAEFARSAERFSIHAAAIVADEGFAVHHRKTRVMRRSVRQQIAGIVVNERLNIRRSDFDLLKAILTNCVRFGPKDETRERLAGRVAFVKSVNAAKGARLEKLLARIAWPHAGE